MFANPWGLSALAALPVIAGIHLFQRRYPPLPVAGLFLWGIDPRMQEAGRRRDRLPISWTLLLECLAVVWAAMALSMPTWGDAVVRQHVVVVLDDSASMQTMLDSGKSIRDTAAAEILKRVRREGDVAVTLIRTGKHPTRIGSRAMRPAELDDALKEWTPSAPRHDFQPAFDDAMQTAGTDNRLLFLTDNVPEPQTVPAVTEVIALGQSQDNVCLSAMHWQVSEDLVVAPTVTVRVTNNSKRAQSVDLKVTQADGAAKHHELEIPAEGEVPLSFHPSRGVRSLKLELHCPNDRLAIDNQAILIEPEPRIVKIANELPAESFERGSLERVLRGLTGLQKAGLDADLLLTTADRIPETDEAETWRLGIGPLTRAKDETDAPVTSRDVAGPYLIEKQHPLLSGVLLNGVLWGGVQPLPDRPEYARAQAFISCGNHPLMFQLPTSKLGGAKSFVMNIDLSRSNLTKTADWPILIANLIELRREALPGLRQWNFRQYERIVFRRPIEHPGKAGHMAKADESLTLRAPSGHRRSLIRDRTGMVEIHGLEDTGVYEVQESGATIERFAVNFLDREESRLASLGSGHIAPTSDAVTATIRIDARWSWIVIAANPLPAGSVGWRADSPL